MKRQNVESYVQRVAFILARYVTPSWYFPAQS